MNRRYVMNCKSAFLAVAWLVVSMPAWAGDVEINWVEPEKYRDIRGGEVNQKRFQAQVIAALTAYFEEAAARTLAADQTLHLNITDVDLAGDVEYFFFRFPMEIRVMRDVYFPSIEFSYELRDANGELIMSGQENLRDMGYLYSGQYYLNDPPFDFEKRMIDDWFNRSFSGEIAQ